MKYSIGPLRVEVRGNAWIAPNASVIGSVILEEDASVWFGAVVRGDNDLITIGRRSNVQDLAVLHTDTGIRLTIGQDVTVGHMVMLHGCTIGDGTLVGLKSTVMNHAKIGRNCIIGAHSLVTEGKEIPDRSLVMGSPGKVIRELTDEEIARVMANADHYVHKITHYRDTLLPQS